MCIYIHICMYMYIYTHILRAPDPGCRGSLPAPAPPSSRIIYKSNDSSNSNNSDNSNNMFV